MGHHGEFWQRGRCCPIGMQSLQICAENAAVYVCDFLCVCVIMEVQKPSGQIQSCQREWGGGVIFSLYKLSPHKVRWMSPEHHKALKAEGHFITSESSSNAFGIHY